MLMHFWRRYKAKRKLLRLSERLEDTSLEVALDHWLRQLGAAPGDSNDRMRIFIDNFCAHERINEKELNSICAGMLLSSHKATEPWEIKIANYVAYLLPRDDREEWFGDLLEARKKLVVKGASRFEIAAITLGRVVLLIWSLVSIKYQDLTLGSRKRIPRQ